MRSKLGVIVLAIALLMSITEQASALPGELSQDYGEQIGKKQSYTVNIPNLYSVDSVTSTNGGTNTFSQNGENVTVNFDNGDYLYSKIPTRLQQYTYPPSRGTSFPETYNYNVGGWHGPIGKKGNWYQISDGYDYYSCSTSIGPQTSSSFPSSTTCYDGGVSVTASQSGGSSSSTGPPYNTDSKNASYTCENSGTIYYDKDGKNLNGTSQSCPSSYSYSVNGYTGTLSRGSEGGQGCGSSGPKNGSCNYYFWASYSGTVSKSVPTTYYTQSYSGSRSIAYSRYQQDYEGIVEGPISEFYRYAMDMKYQTNFAPCLPGVKGECNWNDAPNGAAPFIPAQSSTYGSKHASATSSFKTLKRSVMFGDPDGDDVELRLCIGNYCSEPKKYSVNEYPLETGNKTPSIDLVALNVPDGQYEYVFKLKDARGKETIDNTGVYVWVDSVPPAVTSAVMTSNNSTANRAMPGDQVTLNITLSERPRGSLPVFIGGRPATVVKKTDTTYTAYRVLDKDDTDGNIGFSIPSFEDLATNKSTEYVKTSSGITYDKTPPKATTVTMTTTASTSPYVTTGNRVTLRFTVNEQLKTVPSVTLMGKTVPVSGSYPTYTVNYNMLQDDPDGEINFEINFTDLAGNVSGAITETTDGSKLFHYTVPPRIFPVTLSTNNLYSINYMGVGHTGYLDFIVDKPLKQLPKVKLSNKDFPVTEVADKRYRVIFEADTLPEGKVSLNIYDLFDVVGKPGPTAELSTNGSWLEVDRTAPTFESVIWRIEGTSRVEAMPGDVINLELVASEQLSQAPKITMNTQGYPNPLNTYVPVSVTLAADKKTVTARHTVTALNPEGFVTFVASDYYDLARNKGSNVTSSTTGTYVHVGKESPTLDPVTMVSSNSSDPATAKVGDKVTVNFKSDKPIDPDVEVYIGGSSTSVTKVNSKTWKAERTINELDQEGPLSLQIRNVRTEGSILVNSNTVTATSDGNYVNVVKSSPTANNISIKSRGLNETHAKTGDEVVLEFRVSETLRDDPLVGIGSSFLMRSGGSGLNYQYTYTVKETDPEGQLEFVISNLYSLSGTVGDTYTQTTNGTKVIVDLTPPIVSDVSFSGGSNAGETLTMLIKTSEKLNVPPTLSLNGIATGATFINTDSYGNATYRATQVIGQANNNGEIKYYISDIVDLAGNIGEPVSETSGNAPVINPSSAILITISGLENGGRYKEVVIPVYTAASSKSEDVTVWATMDGNDFISGKPVKGAGTHTLIVYATDGARNSESLTYTFTIE